MRTHWVDLHAVAHELGGGGRDNVIHPLVILRMRCTDRWVVADLQQHGRCLDLAQLQAPGLQLCSEVCQRVSAACECRTCSARNLTPLVGRSSSKVSPRMGLKGFQVRSLPPKGPMQKPATHASLHCVITHENQPIDVSSGACLGSGTFATQPQMTAAYSSTSRRRAQADALKKCQ